MSRALAFIPLRKIDEEKRLVYGIAAEEVLDRAGEIMDYESSKPLFEAWSKEIAEATGGSSLGNLRSMHQPIAAGKLTAIDFDDTQKQIVIAAKVVDDAEWAKVLEGVYTGFSMGGSYAKKWKDADNPTVTRYTGQPIEISLVDLPCIPTAQFEVQKADGTTELRKFNIKEQLMDPTNEEIAARATELAKAAGDETKWSDYMEQARADLTKTAEPEPAAPAEEPAPVVEGQEEIEQTEEPLEGTNDTPEPAEEPEPAQDEPELTEEVAKTMVTQVWASPDGVQHATKAAAVAHVLAKGATPEPTPVDAALKAARDALNKGAAPEHPLGDLPDQVRRAHTLHKAAHAALDASGILAKGLWHVIDMARALSTLEDVAWSAAWEAQHEGDGSAVPGMIAEGFRQIAEALIAMAQEETAEVLACLREKGVTVADLSGLGDAEKAALSEIAEDEPVMQKALGRLAPPATETPSGEALTKMVTESPQFQELQKRADTAEQEVKKAVEGLAELTKRFETLAKSPAPMAPRTSVVEKGAAPDASSISVADAQAQVAEMMKTPEGQRQLAEAAMKMAPVLGRN
jgi:hypothetical protein